jgi:hypothetical protein
MLKYENLTLKIYISELCIKQYTDVDPTVEFVFPVSKIERENSDKNSWKRLMLNYIRTILNIALITFIMIVNIWSCDCLNYYRCNANSNSSGSVKYLIRPDYYIQIKERKTWYYIHVYTTITGCDLLSVINHRQTSFKLEAQPTEPVSLTWQ